MGEDVAGDREDRSLELTEQFSETAEAVAPLLDSDDGGSPDDEEAARETLGDLAATVRDAGFDDLLRAAGVENLPEDPTPADLPELMADADEGDLAVVRRLLGARDLADGWDAMESDERTERLMDLFGGVADVDEKAREGGEKAESDDAEAETDSLADRLREAADELVAGEGSEADEDDGSDEGETDEDEAERRSDREFPGRRRRYSSVPSRRPDMRGVGRASTMPRRRRDG
ncbi:hypothetical protein [Halorarum halobium]|uniref:hypothetical protein n=1 Tax=Halorarum halobium TaxID=3075121 RepID=UPI0028AA6F19|nr:hypothetical protein [Halobaculum sp. XH14]